VGWWRVGRTDSVLIEELPDLLRNLALNHVADSLAPDIATTPSEVRALVTREGLTYSKGWI
jgi:hypothetical protein